MRIVVLTCAVALLAKTALTADPPAIRLQRIVGGFEMPLDARFPDDGSGRLFIVEQRGRVLVMKNGALLSTSFLDWRSKVSCCDERGLLGLAFPKNFAQKQHFYINYTDTSGNSVVSRVRVSGDPDRADANSEEVLLQVTQPFANHNGGNLVFGPDGLLYIGFGDGGSGGDPQNNGQRLGTLLGKMLRIDVESGQSPYTSPPSNPFVNMTGARPEIWAYGLRNPWRYSFDRETGDLWIADVGQNRAEEVNFQPAASKGGENYGWRRFEGLQCYPPGSNCDPTGVTMPILEYGRGLGLSVTGGFVYRGSRYPALRGWYLYGDFGSGNLWGVQRSGASWDNRLLLATGAAISSFGEDPSGEIYLVDYRGSISLITAGPPMTASAAVVNAASFGPGLVPGSLATVFGTGITSLPGIVSATTFPLPTELAGTSVTLNGVRVPITAVADVNGIEQINFQIPLELIGASQASLVLNANGQSSAPVNISLVDTQPEIFAVTRSGSTTTIWATGLGPVTNAPATGRPALAAPLSTLVAQAQVSIGGTAAPVSFAGLAPGFAGLYQVNVTTPAEASTGTPIVLSVGGAQSRPFAFP